MSRTENASASDCPESPTAFAGEAITNYEHDAAA